MSTCKRPSFSFKMLGWVQSMGAPPGVISLSRWFPLKERGTWYSIFSSTPYLGKSLTMVIVGALIGVAGWQWGFLFAAACGLIGTAIILVTHDLEIAFSRADQILMLDHGRCAGIGAPAEIAQQLYNDPVSGLVLPEVMKTALLLRSKGLRVPLSCDPEKVAQALVRERRRSK